MVDLVNIGLSVDSRQVKEGRKELDKFGKQADHTEKSTTKLSKSFKFLAGAVAAFATGALIKSVIDKTLEQERAMAQLDAAVRSTGGSAGFTTKQLADMAAELQKTTTYGDEAIISMQSVLLTFTNLKDQVLPEATKAVLNISTRMGTDLKSSALQVGKALNDPIRGLDGLSRAGIQFSDAQKEVIKSLAESGHMAQAQGMILKELETQFGGAAEAARHTLGGALESLSNAFGDLLEADGQGVSDATSAIESLTKVMSDPKIKQAFSTLTAALIKMVEWVAKAVSAFVDFGNEIGTFFGRLATGVYNLDDAGKKQKTLAERTAEATVKLKEAQSVNKSAREEYEAVSKAIEELNSRYGAGSEMTAGLVSRQQELAKRIVDTANAAKMQQEALDALTAKQEAQAAKKQEQTQQQQDPMQKLLDQAIMDEMELEQASEHKREMLAIEMDYYDRLYNLQTGSQQAALDFANAIRTMDYRGAIEHGSLMLSNLAKTNKTMFQVQKAFALANALVTLPSAVIKSFENGGGYPWGLIPAGLMLAQGLQQINQIKSATFGGGGTPSAPSGGGGAGTAQGAPVASGLPQGSTATPDAKEKQTKEVRVTFEGDNPHSEAMRNFASTLSETLKDMGSDVNLAITR